MYSEKRTWKNVVENKDRAKKRSVPYAAPLIFSIFYFYACDFFWIENGFFRFTGWKNFPHCEAVDNEFPTN